MDPEFADLDLSSNELFNDFTFSADQFLLDTYNALSAVEVSTDHQMLPDLTLPCDDSSLSHSQFNDIYNINCLNPTFDGAIDLNNIFEESGIHTINYAPEIEGGVNSSTNNTSAYSDDNFNNVKSDLCNSKFEASHESQKSKEAEISKVESSYFLYGSPKSDSGYSEEIAASASLNEKPLDIASFPQISNICAFDTKESFENFNNGYYQFGPKNVNSECCASIGKPIIQANNESSEYKTIQNYGKKENNKHSIRYIIPYKAKPQNIVNNHNCDSSAGLSLKYKNKPFRKIVLSKIGKASSFSVKDSEKRKLTKVIIPTGKRIVTKNTKPEIVGKQSKVTKLDVLSMNKAGTNQSVNRIENSFALDMTEKEKIRATVRANMLEINRNISKEDRKLQNAIKNHFICPSCKGNFAMNRILLRTGSLYMQGRPQYCINCWKEVNGPLSSLYKE